MSQFDVVIYGATSVVGQLVVRHFASRYGADGSVSWAIAGRSLEKLNAIKASLGKSEIQVLIADAHDLEALRAMCKQTRVVVSTAGPFAFYGEKLLQACAETGTDYCDITGEVLWVAEMTKRYEQAAKASGARILSFCGFDSIPSDMGVYFIQKAAQQKFAQPCQSVNMRIAKASGNPPGGTYATIMETFREASSDAEVRRGLLNPYALAKSPVRRPVQSSGFLPSYDKDFKQWTAAFVMAGINSRVVHRSNMLSNFAYGTNFLYEEKMLAGPSVIGLATTAAISAGMIGFATLASFKPTRHLLQQYVIPKPGESGQDLKVLEKYGYKLLLIGRTADQQVIRACITGQGDPAAFSTSRMLSEAGLCLALDVSKAAVAGGFWTPATALGDKLIKRLEENAFVHFELMA